MKKYIFMALLGLVTVLPTSAQNYRNSRYYNRSTGRLDYSKRNTQSSWNYHGNYDSKPFYVGFRIGPSFTTVNSDNKYLDGSSSKTGLNVGFAAGFALSDQVPLYLESGLYYTEKGGKNTKKGFDFQYNLNYLEVPFVLKYIYNINKTFSIQPFFGGYIAGGVGGKIKDFDYREAYNSFDDNDDAAFKRFDGGLRMGVGLGIDMFYMDLTYDLGLSNIGHDYFDETKNSALMLNFGVNF